MKALNYYGAKGIMLKHILPYLNIRHHIYIEPFGGSAIVLLNKKRSQFEIYNDIYSEIVNFFRVIRNCFDRKKLQEFIENTPYSREEFAKFQEDLTKTKCKIERAAMFYFLHMSSFSGIGANFSVSKKRHPKLVQITSKHLDKITKRLIGVAIENLDWREIFKRYDSEQSLFYLDPPYVNSTLRTSIKYKCKLMDKDQIDLVNAILKLKGKVILSGYDNKIYEVLLRNGFKKKEYAVDIPSQKFQDSKPERAIECLWLSKHFNHFETTKNFFFK